MKEKIKTVLQRIKHSANTVSGEKFSISLSDNQFYPDFCLKASNDLLIFNNFRKSPAYRHVLEHVNQVQGQAYLNEILKHPEIIANISNAFLIVFCEGG